MKIKTVAARNGKSIKNVLTAIDGFGILVTVLILIAGLLISLNLVTQKAREVSSNSLYAEIKDNLKYETQIIASSAESLYSENKGKMTDRQLQDLVLGNIRDAKYGDSGYFFVYQQDGTRLVAPENRSQEGKNLIGTTDKNGVKLVAGLIGLAKQGGGDLTYIWLNPQSNRQESKVAYACPLKLGGSELVIGTGTYVPMIEETETQIEAAIGRTKNIILLILIPLCLAAAFLILLLSNFYFKRRIVDPIWALTRVADQLALGSVDVTLDKTSEDEIGTLMLAFQNMATNMKDQASAAEKLAQGDLTAQVTVRSEKDLLGHALAGLTERLHALVGTIAAVAEQVDSGSKAVSDFGTALSQSTTEQASTVQQLSASLEEISSRVKLSAESAGSANAFTRDVKTNAKDGSERMGEMLHAMDEIGLSSANIRKVIQVIDSIAFQTNILALNASVEAARAGQHGLGFTVVAEEIRKLAARSAEAAKETAGMIEASAEKVEAGTKMARDTARALDRIVEEIDKAADLVSGIADGSKEEAVGIAQINEGILQASQGVQANAATSEESAAASRELSGQATRLDQAIKVFRLEKAEPAAE